MCERKTDVARTAAIEWMARHDVTSDKFSYGDLAAYADGIAQDLVARQFDRGCTVNGMRLVSTPFSDYVLTGQ
jgi:hypothetical protein